MYYKWYKDGRMIVNSWDENHERVFGITPEYFDDYIGIKRHHNGDIDLRDVGVSSLGNLETIWGYLDLNSVNLTSLGNLKIVSGSLDLRFVNITSLGKLEHVGGRIYYTEDSSTHKLLLNSKFKDKMRVGVL